MKVAFIYALNDPDTGRVRYIGKAKNLVARLTRHLNDVRLSTPCACWIKSLRARGLKPIMEELATIPEGDWQAWERGFIQLYRQMGCDLLNCNGGGWGQHNPRPETRAKMRAVQLGCRHSPESRAKMRAWALGRKASEETRAKIGAAQRGKIVSPETRAKMSAAHRGKRKIQSPETRANMSAVNRGKILSPETRAKMSAAKLGHAVSEKTRAKLSVVAKRRWENWRLRKQLASQYLDALAQQNCEDDSASCAD